MGDYNERRYAEWDGEGNLDPEPPNRDSIWTTSSKKRLPISAMDDHHLLATIHVLRGKSPIGTVWNGDLIRRRGWLNAMANEAYSRGLTIPEVDEKDPIHE